MQLRKAETIGPVDDDRVRGRHVDAGLDNGGTEEKVETLLVEIAHDVLELALAHLPMCDAYARFRHELREHLLHLPDRVDLVVKKIDQAAAFELAQHGFA